MEFEEFFDETKEEAFFVKNLENVQGDERDTIIFSIGYAKDQNGIMYMNFGPLSQNGGYRRLNVAITRAKYNVKLVGSIKPNDIDLERTTSEGVRMLREYIEFAIKGPDALQSEIIEPEKIYTESPFEEEVYKFLRGKGYNVVTQVGCSGYRVDMVVKHPTISGKYAIGIECDGATYHSARTARERDRLREEVLKSRGWKLYRIWSTDWIKDPNTASRKLLDAIEDAINNTTDVEYDYNSKTHQEDVFGENEVLNNVCFTVDESEKRSAESGYGFIEYEEVNVRSIERLKGESGTDYISRVIKHVVEIEGPIHFDLLCEKLAVLFGREKATENVKKIVKRIIMAQLKDSMSILDDFCWIKGKRDIKVRVPFNLSGRRRIEHICKEELAEAMYSIVKYRFSITYDALFVETARAFGFNRTGHKIQDSLMNALIYLIDTGRVQEKGDKISLVKSQ